MDNKEKTVTLNLRDLGLLALPSIAEIVITITGNNPLLKLPVDIFFSGIQEIKIKRIEKFLADVKQDLEGLEDKIREVSSQHNHEEFFALYELLLYKVMNEPSKKKRDYFRFYHFGMVTHPINGDYDEKRFFLDTLDGMTLTEIEVLAEIYGQNSAIKLDELPNKVDDKYLLLGIVYRLQSYGFIHFIPSAIWGSGSANTNDKFQKIVESTLSNYLRISTFGAKFGAFCLVGDIE